ncbi:hypothetical protein KY348_06220 [Candidatus Woesearchaeota archaeon]|nr:hypothetical protein [Candidatus Woesearchaeota archaeon]
MSTITIILIVIGAFIILFVTKFLSKTFKIITKIFVLLIIIFVVLTLLVYKDMGELRRGFVEQNNTFYLYDNNQLYTAVTLKPMTSANLTIDSFTYFTQEDIIKAEEKLNKENYKDLLLNNYRIFVLKPDILDKPYTLKLGAELDEKDLLNIIMSKESFLVLAEKTKSTYNISIEDLKKSFEEHYGSEEKVRGYLFAALLTNYFKTQEAGGLVSNVKSNQLKVFPETISFKVIKYLPWI